MNSSIWKYSAPLQDLIRLMLPEGAQTLSVQMQGGGKDPQLWVFVPDVGAPRVERQLIWLGTGQSAPANPGRFIGTVQLHGGALVFHLFEQEP